jgi:hypothetical protein
MLRAVTELVKPREGETLETAMCRFRTRGCQGSTVQDLDLSLIADSLKAERGQGITIDLAYRFFSSPRRKFIIADTPGHEQYTSNMATGASNADLALVLVDASRGVVTQSRRHAFVAALLRGSSGSCGNACFCCDSGHGTRAVPQSRRVLLEGPSTWISI